MCIQPFISIYCAIYCNKLFYLRYLAPTSALILTALIPLTIVLLFDFVSSFAVTEASRITGLRQLADIQAHKCQPEQCLETSLA
jgi:hypothetical protein